ncbi:hypothetical protein GWI33_001693 [Rhynchophorus ferrugineus]|uniref:Uncharacterized protein n=1 Tax=Rhynchophorus ferrugineus TaxID=354439 RepID=A0A834IZV2_RHYFE|nr:hypothetical protein GWI33_001693 [Rhynchophorus ferrugineus]
MAIKLRTKYTFSAADIPRIQSKLATSPNKKTKIPGRAKLGGGFENVQTTTQGSSGLLNVEETPTPTSSIETEDSNTREVGEKDVEGDGEQSD